MWIYNKMQRLDSFNEFLFVQQSLIYPFLLVCPFIAVDGTFIETRFQQILLLAVVLDANNNILVLAWAIVESENRDSWRYFVMNFLAALPIP